MESEQPRAAVCLLCGERYSLPEDELEGNLPRVLLCGHIYCSSCLRPLEHNSTITCPQCEVESMLPEAGVDGLTEDCRIIGLLYTTKMNKKRPHRSSPSTWPRNREPLLQSGQQHREDDSEHSEDLHKFEQGVDEALVRATENLAQLENIQETLQKCLTKQVSRERSRLQSEITQATSEAIHCIQKWKESQLEKLPALESYFTQIASQMEQVEERVRSLRLAIQKAREVRRVKFLEKYCPLDEVLETLQAPVDNQLDLSCLSEVTGLRCGLNSHTVEETLTVSLDLFSNHKDTSQSEGPQWLHSNDNPKALCSSSPGSRSPSLAPSPSLLCQGSTCDLAPDVIIEEVFEDIQQVSLPPTGPQPAYDQTRSKRRKTPASYTRSVTQWVVVTHVVNPNHFYVQYVAEKKEGELLSKKINLFCSKPSSLLCAPHTLDTGSLIFVKYKDGLWHRARVMELSQAGYTGRVKCCPVMHIASVQVFFIDTGLTTAITVKSENRESDALLKAVNNYLRRMVDVARAELDSFAPQAIRCCLKDLVPYDLTKGWTKEAQVEFCSMVNSTTVKMHTLGQDKDSLLVDLKKVPLNRASGPHISVREHLVFIEVARFYSPVTVSKKPLLYYPPVSPRTHTELNAVVSYIHTPGDFYIQLVDNMESLLLSEKLQKFYSTPLESEEEDLRIYCPVIGEACVALFEDKMWYRAQITGHPGGRKVEVVYVDFGNKEILPVTDLRKIKDEFFALPAMAIHCCLSDVVPLDGRNWSEACSSRFISLANQKLVTMVATAKRPRYGPVPVKLFESSLNGPLDNIGEKLVKEVLACLRDGSSQNSSRHSSEDSTVWDPPLEPGSDGASAADIPSDFQPQLPLPAQLKEVKVRISHVNSPSSFYVQLTKYDPWLKRVCELLRKECTQRKPEDVVWKAGMYCAAYINGIWERAQLCADVLSSDIAEVIRCDHGNKAKLHISNLLLLPPELVGSLALECTLYNIRPAGGRSTWTATACDFISFYLSGASAILTAKEVGEERPVPVTLSCSNTMGQFVSIADSLVSQGLALRERRPMSDAAGSVVSPKEADVPDCEKKRTLPSSSSSTAMSASPLSSLRPKPSPRCFRTIEMIQTPLYHAPELPCPGHLLMTISAIGEDGTIYARTPNAERQLEQLKKMIQQSMKFNPCQKNYTWKSVEGCVIYGPDMLWHRGQRLEVLGGHVKVQYIDYGHVESIPVVHVHPRLLCEDVPQLCVPFQLHGIAPVGGSWQREAVALLSELLLNRCVDVHILELPTDPRGPLTVQVFVDGLSLSTILSENNHGSLEYMALPSQATFGISAPAFLDDWDIDIEGMLEEEEQQLSSFIYPDLPTGENFPVRVKHLRTPNELFLWLLEGLDTKINGETLDDALIRINTAIDKVPRLSSFPRGCPCLAEYSDGKYYRALIMDISSVQPLLLLVHHVDYGSDDTLPPTKLRQMLPELLPFPTRALKVKVAGFKASLMNREEDILPYSPMWSVQAAMDMLDLLCGYITATVVAREPELTVLLYNEDGQPVYKPLVSSGLAELE
ncbi:RING finger protein 17 [Periophthalmus magnuspinnatus]|uniref:RING finger protein 17 n=1 Tax=Periophthalmus magnuspinnatus TaxID=409849 RepID=UPI002436E8E9|nr:RING finger protein 17 [Periophthalmus magnuspinnatus]